MRFVWEELATWQWDIFLRRDAVAPSIDSSSCCVQSLPTNCWWALLVGKEKREKQAMANPFTSGPTVLPCSSTSPNSSLLAPGLPHLCKRQR